MFQLTDTQLKRAKRPAQQGLRISVQPIWVTELVKANFENMGPQRARTGFRFKTLIDAGLEPAVSTDMAVLTEDILIIAPEAIHTVTAAAAMIVGGRVVFCRD